MTITASRADLRSIAFALMLVPVVALPATAQDLSAATRGLPADTQDLPTATQDLPTVGRDLPPAGQDVAGIRGSDVAAPAAPAPVLGLPKGALVFHGNYCGPGNRGNNPPPVDALDRACMHHDACSPPVGEGLPPCSCNQRLYNEASAIAQSPRTPDDLRVAADFVAEGAKALSCR